MWKGADTQNVELIWPVWTADRSNNRLQRIVGTEYWVKSVIIPAQTRLSYRFAPDMPVTAKEDRRLYLEAVKKKSQTDPLNPKVWRTGEKEDFMSIIDLPSKTGMNWMQVDDRLPSGTIMHSNLFS